MFNSSWQPPSTGPEKNTQIDHGVNAYGAWSRCGAFTGTRSSAKAGRDFSTPIVQARKSRQRDFTPIFW